MHETQSKLQEADEAKELLASHSTQINVSLIRDQMTVHINPPRHKNQRVQQNVINQPLFFFFAILQYMGLLWKHWFKIESYMTLSDEQDLTFSKSVSLADSLNVFNSSCKVDYKKHLSVRFKNVSNYLLDCPSFASFCSNS